MLAASYDQAPFGANFGSGSDLLKTFWQPFADVFKTGAAELKKLSRRVQTVVAVAFQTIKTTLIPAAKSNYKEIFKKQEDDIQKIKNEYKDVYDRTKAALSSNDAKILSFLMFPEFVITKDFVKNSPFIAMDLISIASGGSLDDQFDAAKEKMGKWGWTKESISYKDSYLLEKKDESKQKSKEYLGNILSNEKNFNKMISAIAKNPRAQKLKSELLGAYENKLNAVIKSSQVLADVKTIQDLRKALKNPGLGGEEINKLDPKEREKSEKMIIQSAKEMLKNFYSGVLEKELSELKLPDGHPLTRLYTNAISKIKGIEQSMK